jgi:hypothetical protein
MKYLAGVYTLITIFAIALLPQAAFADSSTSVDISNNGDGSHNEVNVQSNTGGNTICQNGNCTTTSGGNGQSTVCINGNCQSSNGNIDMQSDDGNDQVHINNDTSDSPTATVTPVPTDATISISPESSLSPVPSMTPDPTIAQMRKQVRKQIKEQVKQLKEHVKDQDAALSTLVQSLQNLLNGLFK